jgi:cytochrome c-type biogenesis protein CcmH/NrfG
MSSVKAAMAAASLAVMIAAALWFGMSRKAAPVVQTPTMPSAPPNAAHEKASLEEQLRKKPGHAPVLLRLAQLAMERGEPAEARRRLEELLKTEPKNLEALLELGRACYELNDLPCAIAETGKVLAADGNHVDALYNMGAIHANTGDAAKARQYWRKAVQSAPDSDSGRKSAAAIKQLGAGGAGGS